MSVVLHPIGRVVSPVTEPSHQEWESVVAEVVVEEAYAGALDGLEEFSHVIVIFHFHRSESRLSGLRIHPERRQELPLVGVFATRTPVRPNPIGVTTVRLLERRGNVLRVQGLDAIDGTPVLDIKPHIPVADTFHGVRVPRWIDVLSGKESGRD